MVDLEALARQNPWWNRPSAIAEDFHLRRLAQKQVRLLHPVEDRLRLDLPGLRILRGPRQIGKTTLLKRLVQRLLGEGVGGRSILFLALDVAGIRSHGQLAEALRWFLGWQGGDDRKTVLIDEAPYCGEWALGIKVAYDQGLLSNTLMVVTGSHTLDLRRGEERLPGRRGLVEADSDLEIGPFPFRQVAIALGGAEPVQASSWAVGDLLATATENQIRVTDADRLFEFFLASGGLPLAVNDMASSGQISRATAATYRQAVLGDILRAGKRENLFRELIGAVIQLGGESVDWHGLGERVSFGSKNTVAEYLEVMERVYLLSILPQPVVLGSPLPAPRKMRKLHLRDPFLHHVFEAWTTGNPDPWSTARQRLANPEQTGRLVESPVVAHLLPYFRHLMHWRGRGEIDIIGIAEGSEQVHIEVKYQQQVTSGDRRTLKRTGGGILLSQNVLGYSEETKILTVPVPLFLLSLPRTGPPATAA